MRRPMLGNCLPAFLLLLPLLLSCGDSATGPDLPDPPGGPGPGTGTSTRIVIEPGALLLPPGGASVPLIATAYDAAGQSVQADITWESSNPAVLSVSDDGEATGISVGSTQITARALGTASVPMLALVAEPAPGAVVVPDSLILSDAPDPVDLAAAYVPGWQYRIRMRGIAPAAGQILLAQGDAPVAGRVVTVSGGPDTVVVTLALMSLDELFTQLVIDETISLDKVEPALAPAIRSQYGIGRLPGGAILVHPTAARRHASRSLGLSEAGAVDFTLGPFKCSAKGSVPSIDLPSAEFDVTPSLSLSIRYLNRALALLAVHGTIKAEASLKPSFEVAYEGEADCAAELFAFPIPLGGPLALLVGGQVPIGVGMSLTGKLSVAEVGFTMAASVTATTSLGVECAGGGACTLVKTFDPAYDTKFEFTSPDPSEQFRVELAAWPYGWAQLKLGNRWIKAAQFEAVDARAGLEQLVNFATAEGQVSDAEYASGFALQTHIKVGPGKDLQKLLDLLGISAGDATFEHADTIETSPAGTITVPPDSIAPGDSVTVSLNLSPVTYAGLKAVDSVAVLWRQVSSSDDTTYIPLPGDCGSLPASSGQTEFTCEAAFQASGDQTLYGLVYPSLFGASLPLPLELGPDAMAVVTVADECRAPPADYAGPIQTFNSIASGNASEDGEISFEILDAVPGRIGVSASAKSLEGDQTRTQRASVVFEDLVDILPIDADLFFEPVILSIEVTYRLEVDGPSGFGGEARVDIPFAFGPPISVSTSPDGSTVASATRIIEFPMHTQVPDHPSDQLRFVVGVSAFSWNRDQVVTAKAELTFKLLEILDLAGEPFPVKSFCTASDWDWASP